MSDELLGDTNVELYPAWRQALVTFLEARFPYDHIVPHEWWYDALGLDTPDYKRMTGEKIKELELKRLTQFERLREALLEEHQIALVSEPGLGYRIVSPREQSKLALAIGMAENKKTTRKMVAMATHVNTASLTADERREHADNVARVAAFASMYRRVRALPTLDEE